MKKKIIPILCLSLLCCLMVFLSCNKDKNYQTNVYEHIPGYKSTACNILRDKNIELHVENTVSNSKDEISLLLNSMQADYSILSNVFNLDTQIKCYIIADEFILGNDKAVYQKNILICNKNAVDNGKDINLWTLLKIREIAYES